jgi:hypothetical protein
LFSFAIGLLAIIYAPVSEELIAINDKLVNTPLLFACMATVFAILSAMLVVFAVWLVLRYYLRFGHLFLIFVRMLLAHALGIVAGLSLTLAGGIEPKPYALFAMPLACDVSGGIAGLVAGQILARRCWRRQISAE